MQWDVLCRQSTSRRVASPSAQERVIATLILLLPTTWPTSSLRVSCNRKLTPPHTTPQQTPHQYKPYPISHRIQTSSTHHQLKGDSPRNLTLCFSFKHGRIFNVGGKWVGCSYLAICHSTAHVISFIFKRQGGAF